MELQLIRNATIKLNYAGQTILVDPMLCEKEYLDPFMEGLGRNPTVDLNIEISEITQNVDAILLTHSHPDHFDVVAANTLDKNIQVLCTETDIDFIKNFGFENNLVLNDNTLWKDNISITPILAQHGSGTVLNYMGKVSGYILKSQSAPTIYLTGDTIVTEDVKNAIDQFQPEIIITNSGGGLIPGFESTPVIMDEEQTILICNMAKESKIVAVHLESIDFCRVTRKSMREYAKSQGISKSQLLIPEDGEIISF